MPKWIHDRADHLEKKNPSMPKSEAFAIATQQAYASDKAPSKFGTSEGKQKAHKKYNKSENRYESTADPKEKTSMNSTMHGHMPLADMISQAISDARTKIASAETVEEDTKVEETEKVASAEDTINISNKDEVEKLAAALEQLGEKIKEADKVDHGEESNQGGVQLPVNTQKGGKQSYAKDKAHHQLPTGIGLKAGGDNGKSPTLLENDAKGGEAKFLKQPYPKTGVLKVSAAQNIKDQLKAKAEEETEKEAADLEELKDRAKKAKDEADKTGKFVKHDYEKKSEALDFLLDKMSSTRFSKESPQGGMTLDSAAEEGTKLPSGGTNSARSALKSNKAPVAFTKGQAKAPQKPLLKEVLTEPALTKSTDSKLQDNLQNTGKAGVKIAAEQARVYLQKIKEAGCTCDGKGECKYCKMKSSMDKSKA